MLHRSKHYERREPERDATLFLIFCEGADREPEYFKYFVGLSSQIKIIPVAANPIGDNSPVGLYDTALKVIEKTEDNPAPEYQIDINIDQVWFVIDTDKWEGKIDELKSKAQEKNWFVAQSNPCFEVWLYFHFHDYVEDFEGQDSSTTWKKYLNTKVLGGFDHRKHPIYVEKAILNAKANFQNSNEGELPPCTDLFLLANQFLPFVKKEIDKALIKNASVQ